MSVETLLDIIDASARRFGNRPALLIKPGFRTKKWTFADLADLIPRVARALADAGVRPGDRVILWAVPRPEWGIAFFSALHAGAIVVPLDHRSQPEFAKRVAERTEARFVLAATPSLEPARGLGLAIQTIESLPDLARDRVALPRAQLRSDGLVEIVFTSGTTGDPKGVMLTHRNLVTNAEAVLEVFPFGPKQRMLSIFPLSHMMTQTAALVAPLLAGASVAYPTSLQPAVLMRSFRDFHATMLLVVPHGLRLIDNAIERKVDQGGKRALFERLHRMARRLPMWLRPFLFLPVHAQFGGMLRYIGVGAAALDPKLGERWMEMGVHVLQGYGMTEASPVVSFNRPQHNRVATVGQPIPGVEVRIADDREVLVRGPNVFPGYWRNEEATRAVLDADGWYHTGDIGELDADRFLTLHGRKKDMLALPDGTKVYPEDIENVLVRDPRLRDATVVGLERPGVDLHVHAVLLLDDPAQAEAIVRDTNAKVASHQQIRGYTVWPKEDFPRTPTLKVKKREVLEVLATEAPTATQESASAGPPLGDVQRIVAQVANAPGARVSREARLSTDLNLDSLQRVELLGIVEEELGVYIDDATLDADATVGRLEELVERGKGERRETGIFAWPLSPLVRLLGMTFQEVLIGPLMWVLYRVTVTGRDNLRGLRGPVMFTPNHCLHWDNGIILSSIPLGWRWRLSVAAAADDIFGNPLRGIAAAVLANAFPLAREGAIRRSLELLGARLDRDFSVLIYPEGKLTVGGPMQPFKAGTGLIAVEGGTPVVPMKLKINRMSIADRLGGEEFRPRNGHRWGLRGDVEVVFGTPIVFASETDFAAATERIQAAVAAL